MSTIARKEGCVASTFALYRMFAADGRLIYVGQTSDPGTRVGMHRRSKDWWREVASIQLAHFDTREDLLRAEREAIETERPQYNIVYRCSRRAAKRAPVEVDVVETAVEVDAGETAEIEGWLEDARLAREGRDLWRAVGPTLRKLREAGVSYSEIQAATGVAPSVVAWHVSRTGGSSPSTEGR
jgi:predicted GIY-YIG superfamily endonuclease